MGLVFQVYFLLLLVSIIPSVEILLITSLTLFGCCFAYYELDLAKEISIPSVPDEINEHLVCIRTWFLLIFGVGTLSILCILYLNLEKLVSSNHLKYPLIVKNNFIINKEK